MTAIVWFRRDLRVHEHPALRAALEAHDAVVPVFCLDDRLLHGRHESAPGPSSCSNAWRTSAGRCASAVAGS